MPLMHVQLVAAIYSKHPTVGFGYSGDGSSLEPHTTADGGEGRGLEWPATATVPPPTYAEAVAWAAELAALGLLPDGSEGVS